MPNEVRIKTSAPGAKQTTKEVTDLKSAYKVLQDQGAKGLGVGIGAGATIAALSLVGKGVGAVTDVIGDALGAASDLNETMSKSSVVFGDSARQVSSWGDTSAKAFGLSKQAAIEAAASFGNVFKGLGFASDASAKMSERLVELAGDLASFNNIDPTEALQKLKSGLAGEAEPLRAVGVFLNEATVKAKAMSLGLGDAHGELTEGEKILARYQLILDQTSTAQGDFARTADGVANSQRSLNAELENMKAALGEDLIPVQKSFISGFDDLLTGINNVADVVNLQNKSYQEQAQILRAGGVLLATHTQEELNAAAAAIEAQGALDAARDAIESHHTAVASDTKAVGRMSSATDDLAKTMEDTEKATKDLDRAIGDLSSTIEDELFGDAINAGNEARLKENIRDLEKQRVAAHKGSPAWIELTGEIAENRKELFKLHLEEAARKGPQAAIDFLRKEALHAGDAKDEIAALIRKYQALANLQGDLGPIIVVGGAPHGPAKKHAAGGHMGAGELGIVGEEGPEVFVPDSAGTIIPNGGMSGGGMSGGGSLTLNINVTGAALSPAMSAAFAQQAGPAIADYLKRRALI